MSLNFEALFAEMAKTPQVREAVKAKAEKLREYMEVRWPEVNDIDDAQRQFLDEQPDRTILVSEATDGTNRPVHVVTVRHPGAVAKQAKSGFVTKAVKDVS